MYDDTNCYRISEKKSYVRDVHCQELIDKLLKTLRYIVADCPPDSIWALCIISDEKENFSLVDEGRQVALSWESKAASWTINLAEFTSKIE